jgi:hypothetical protein
MNFLRVFLEKDVKKMYEEAKHRDLEYVQSKMDRREKTVKQREVNVQESMKKSKVYLQMKEKKLGPSRSLEDRRTKLLLMNHEVENVEEDDHAI